MPLQAAAQPQGLTCAKLGPNTSPQSHGSSSPSAGKHGTRSRIGQGWLLPAPPRRRPSIRAPAAEPPWWQGLGENGSMNNSSIEGRLRSIEALLQGIDARQRKIAEKLPIDQTTAAGSTGRGPGRCTMDDGGGSESDSGCLFYDIPEEPRLLQGAIQQWNGRMGEQQQQLAEAIRLLAGVLATAQRVGAIQLNREWEWSGIESRDAGLSLQEYEQLADCCTLMRCLADRLERLREEGASLGERSDNTLRSFYLGDQEVQGDV